MRVPTRFGVPPRRAPALAFSVASTTLAHQALPHGTTLTVTLSLALRHWPSSAACAWAVKGKAAANANSAVLVRIRFMIRALGRFCGGNGTFSLPEDERNCLVRRGQRPIATGPDLRPAQ